ncbi:peptide-methionine (S)-S-oxide reductase [Flavivirga abyssicola]|uniref:peptide-methionine (S)-S-oxide reductase n=1 Tax=Flavivirga abyssicola TaxID=3063533 RepID=UPI0026E076BB|nr:peptide-methionine (S)-S-oxide reductase [Flavivirga sp. MEBiC07777]WVK11716.1 peptide-methionine (S)-S-oxide reductase [Flavivirga sp. MEBiC07777]
MNSKLDKIALGGGCHWCTEAIFQSLIGVVEVEQGYVASVDENSNFSEAIIVHFNMDEMSLKTLIEMYLHTHKSTSNYSMRSKYRSAVYTFSEEQKKESEYIIENFQKDFEYRLITKVYPFQSFEASREAIQNYYQKNPEKPFCKTFIDPKLKYVMQKFSCQINQSKVAHIATTTV